MLAVVCIAIVVTVALGAVLYLSSQYRDATNRRVNQEVASIELLHNVQTAMLNQGSALAVYYILPQPTYAQSFRDSRATAESAFASLRVPAGVQQPDEVASIDQLYAAYTAVANSEEQTLEALERGDTASAIALATGPANLEQSSPAVRAALDRVTLTEQDQLSLAQRDDHRAQLWTFWLTTIIVGIWGLLVVAVGIFALRWLVRPLERASRAARSIAAGDLTMRVASAGPFELARLGTEVNRIAEALIERSEDLNAHLADEIRERTRLIELGADVGSMRAGEDSLPRMLDGCTAAIVRDLDAALARIWTMNDAEGALDLRASSGMYAHLDGGHARIIVGEGEIGAIAARRASHTTNDVLAGGDIADPDWALREGIVAFAGYPLMVKEECMGVMGVFARKPISDATLEALDAVARDIALAIIRMRDGEAMRRSQERLRRIAESTSVGIYQLSRERRVIYLNAAACLMLEVQNEQEAAQVPFEEFFTKESLETMRTEQVKRAEGITSSYEIEVIGVLGTHRHVLVSGAVLFDESGEADSVIGTMVDISDRKRQEAALQHAASHDPLTDVLNRRRFQEDVNRYLSQSTPAAAGAVLFLDLDDFKAINDTFGHPVGDMLLVEVARTLRKAQREGDILARFGGDEFAIFLPHATRSGARQRANTLLAHLRRETAVIDGHAMQSLASIGIAMAPEHSATASELLARADLAMYEAKRRGRNRVSTYSSRRGAGAGAVRLDWKRRIRDAIEHDRLMFYCQPVVNLRTNQIDKYELLLRMSDERGRVVLPGSFLSVAEEYGLISDIDSWVVRTAVRLIATERRAGRDLRCNVNLTARALDDASILQLIRRELAQTGIDPASICFEITESAAVSDIDRAVRLLSSLAELGCELSIDDFGVGFSSFSQMKHLPVHELKIDGSFIESLKDSPVDQHLVRGIVEMARGLGLRVVAEFVQDAESVELLRRYGVEYGQGYFLGRPFPAEDLATMPHALWREARAA